jgi:hypothetical protein
MVNIIAGAIGLGAFLVFIGFYFIRLHFIPLWLIIIGVVSLVIADFVHSVKETTEGNNNR